MSEPRATPAVGEGPAKLPMVFPLEGLPARVRIHEVGPRDGLQNEQTVVPVEVKAEFIRRLAAAGLDTIEATSFVHPKWVPQLADAEELYPLLTGTGTGTGTGTDTRTGTGTDGGASSAARLTTDAAPAPGPPEDAPVTAVPLGDVRLPVLVPNTRGLERALALGAREVAVFASATESFAKANLNRTVDEALAMFEPVVGHAKRERLRVRGYLSMCFGDPWEGPVPLAQVVHVCRALADMGCDELSLGDTIGVATPGHVTALLSALAEAGLSAAGLAVHFHDTYGQALANTLTALQQGVTTVDASAGGLGGCPYAKSATGNLATEDLVWMLHGLGIETGTELGSLSATSLWMAERLGRPSPSRTVRALAGAASQKEH